jgi:hypothetical protein
MPTVKCPKLTLTRKRNEENKEQVIITLTVKYVAEFSKLELYLIEHGLNFQEQIAVMEVDPPSEPTSEEELVKEELVGKELVNFTFDFDPKDLTDRLELTRTLDVDRTQLQEDPMVGDTDEICCRIRIAAFGLPSGVTPDVFTNEQVLFDSSPLSPD